MVKATEIHHRALRPSLWLTKIEYETCTIRTAAMMVFFLKFLKIFLNFYSNKNVKILAIFLIILILTGLINSYHRRPDSSSSASSATDWEGNGQGTVLRRGHIPPVSLPQLPQSLKQNLESHLSPIVYPKDPHSSDSDLGSSRKVQSSSDSDFPESKCRSEIFQKSRSGIKTQISTDATSTPVIRNIKIPRTVPVPVDFKGSLKNGVRQNGVSQRVKPVNDKSGSRNRTHSSINVLDRLSVRTELGLNHEDGIMSSGKGLYYFPADEESELSPANDFDDKLNTTKKATEASNPIIQDQIIATQLRRLNRELTPTISDVYHERNIGLGLAPPLSKLLISNQAPNASFRTEKDSELPDLDNIVTDNTVQEMNSLQKGPWLSKSNLNLHTNESLEISSNEGKIHGSPCSDLSKRDEGDGRSVAESQCSASSFKKALASRVEKPDTSEEGLYYDATKDQGTCREVPEVTKPPMPKTRTSKGPPPPVPSSRNKIS